MFKKLILAGMAITAFAAFVLPATASASPELTENGVTVPVGALIEGRNVGNTLFTGPFEVVCGTAILTGSVTKNTGTKVEGTIPAKNTDFTGTATGGDCTSLLGATRVEVNSELCLTTAAAPADTFSVTGCAGAPVQFTLEVTGTGKCKYSTAAVNGSYTTNVTPNPVVVSEQEAKKIEGGFFCPASGKLDMTFNLYTDGTNTGLTIS
jgi:hypothetical protein